MILSCRAVIKFDLACKFTNTFLIQKSGPFLQRTCCLFHGFNHSNCKASIYLSDMKTVADRKKSKLAVWRPVSSQASSSEVDKQVGEVQDIMFNSVSENEGAHVEDRAVNEVAAFECTSSSGLKKDDGSELLAEELVPLEQKHSIRIEAAAPLIRFIKEKESSTRKKIEEMGVQIIFPLGKKDEYIIIEGISRECVTTASEKLHILIKEAIKSPALNYTHFVSLPLAIHPQLVEKLFNFQNSILGISNKNEATCLDDDKNEDTTGEESREIQLDSAPVVAVDLNAEKSKRNPNVGIRNILPVGYPPKASKPSKLDEKTTALSALGIDKSIFIKPKTFHLTVLMLKLYNKELVDLAANVLQSLPTKIMHALDGQPVAVRLKGLECMRGSFAKARVLYAPVEVIGGEDRLLRACQVIIDAFTEAGLVLEKDAHQKLKLHATLMNTSHRKRNKMTRRADTFDARGIVEQYGSEEWGEYPIREAHLSRRMLKPSSTHWIKERCSTAQDEEHVF
ncbi:Eukaryotic LigT [Heracleum sosnowskyi]|uniref:Eukaryotic LigT n=1 Tax=Heracleum sosnowskyi TaxID=360622 RepID=A0AAD8HZN4_9APIA|nr:Eukaryotic LigT [Heracleum sosnowskyi]